MKHIFESGRSMVEMLGTLAIIGVLSIGGIMGYSYGMDKYRANETLNELQLRIIDLSQQMQNKAFDLSLGEMGNTTRMGYPISARVSPQFADYFEVFIDNVPSGVCHRLLESKWTLPYSIFVGIDEYEADDSICDKAETVTLAYEFKDDLTDGESIAEEDRHETWRCHTDGDCKCATCEDGLCVTLCPEGSSCGKSYDNPNSWMCCLNDVNINGLCCASVGENGECCTSNDNCCPPDKPLRGSNGLCYSCDDETVVNVEGMTSNCAVCSNRLLTTNKKCAIACGRKGTPNADKPLMDALGKCHACDAEYGIYVYGVESAAAIACPKRYISGTYGGSRSSLCGVAGTSVENKPLADTKGSCHSCDDPKSIEQLTINAAYRCKNICKNRSLGGNYCYPDMCPASHPIRDGSGNCQDCSYNGSVYTDAVSGECSVVCPNRKVENGKCILVNCPADKPLMDALGKCHACDAEYGIYVYGVESAAAIACPKRYISGTYGGSRSSLCGVAGTSVENKPLADSDGSCHSCDDPESIEQRTINAAYRCKNICKNRSLGGDYCYPDMCPASHPIRDGSGNCQDCSYNGSVYTDAVSGECSVVCPNRKVENGKCILVNCPADKPLKDASGKCHACDAEYGIYVYGVESAAAIACPKRYISGTYGGSRSSLCGVAGTSVENKPLADSDGSCHSCDDPESIEQRTINAAYKCENVCENRTSQGVQCLRNACSPGVPLVDSDGNCHPCNDPSSIYVGPDEEKCKVCVNRRFEDGYCLLN